ncbi:hypothetical protein PR048_017482 [Dryococelus australis]|uniref:Uncharacterized protein n=1 Tax=Dryococelus australis TaxID=614101 RepID=A0ABQ9H9Q5_9NEOP|nr:hypothetical protein PR048_017482 [Dryococelus australis]
MTWSVLCVGRVSSSTLGRLSKSTSRLVGDSPVPPPTDSDPDYTRSAQTLPRKLLYEKRQQQQSSSQWQHRTSPGLAKSPHSSSLINVSIINNVTPPAGPAKPARTYRSNLARSKSFNVHAAGEPVPPSHRPHADSGLPSSSVYKSNPQLHRLDESPPPLKSPGILASISRSQRDLTDSAIHEEEDTKKRLFMRNLMDRAPELFKTLHGDEDVPPEDHRPGRLFSSTPVKNGYTRHVDHSESFRSSSTNATPPDGDAYRRSSPFRQSVVNGGDRVVSPSFQNGNTTRSVVRKGSPGTNDFSETVRITSKSADPIRPSVTNTVQSFTKKTIPTKGGLSTETIESSETTTVTKSRVRAGEPVRYQENGFGKYGGLRNGNGGVVIEVRPSRK